MSSPILSEWVLETTERGGFRRQRVIVEVRVGGKSAIGTAVPSAVVRMGNLNR